jgi:Recombination endonuclease VII
MRYKQAPRWKYNAKYRAANKEKLQEYNRQWGKANREKKAASNRKLRGIPDPTRPLPMICECCNRPPGRKQLAVDHDHKTGKFRGWLCSRCNTGIGSLGDTMEAIELAVDYLRRSMLA